MKYNNREFWSTMIMIVLVFVCSWILGLIFKPIIIAVILSILIIIWKSNTIWLGIKHYWNLLMSIIVRAKTITK
jgi:hypothetical protein